MLHSALDDARSMLTDYRAKMRSKSVADTHNNMATQSEFMVGVDDIQGPSRVTTKGRPRSKRLGANMDRSIKKYVQRRKRNLPPDNDVQATGNEKLTLESFTNFKVL
ncbi:hypothetical protein AHAS_Ahas15G0304100 [Arachis hypogaea]